MKLFFTLLLIPISLSSLSAQETSNYFILINSDSIPVSLDKTVQYKSPKGELLNIRLAQPENLTFNNDFFSFKYSKEYAVTSSDLGDGVWQHMIMSPMGSGVMIQEFSDFNPVGMEEIFLNEITKETVNYGYDKKENKVAHTLANGQEIKGIQYELSYKNEFEVYTVYSMGKKDEGILIITMLLDQETENLTLIQKFLDTFSLKE